MLPNNYRWHEKEIVTSGTVLEKILYARGVQTETERNLFINPTKEQLHSPFLLNDMKKAIKRIEKAKAMGEHIVIYGDYDVDGVTSTSILYMFLKEEGFDVSYYIPNRTEEGYGLNNNALTKIREYGQLVITVDTGIAANQEVEHAQSIGLDIIITDHHECQEVLPDAYCILNPKRRDTTYPFDALAGVGVTFKLIHGLAITRQVEDKIWKYIDIVALGTVADVVPLENENRVITYLGFKAMANSYHLGVRALLDVVQTTKDKITSYLIGYQLGPRINAAGRIGDAKEGVKLLTTTSKEEAKMIAEQLDLENKKRQEMEQHILQQAEQYIADHIDVEHEKFIIVAGEEWHHGVIGIVASRVMNKYYKPTIILTKEDGVYSGSARSVEGFNIFEAINAVKSRLLRFGGHEMAAGLSLEASQLDDFRKEINAYSDELLTDEILTPALEIDLAINVDEVSLHLCDELEKMEPFGVNNKTPLFAIQGKVQYTDKIGQGKHLKLSIQKGQHVLQGIGFDKGDLADELTEGEEVIIACELAKNVWNGKVSLQFRVKDIISPLEMRLQSSYYEMLYKYAKELTPIEPDELTLVEVKEGKTSTLINYTEEKILLSLKQEENKEKYLTKRMELWYNDSCNLADKTFGEWDFVSKGTFYCLDPSLERHQAQLSKMIPSYIDCRNIYKYLRLNNGILSIHKTIQTFQVEQMTEYKLFQVLDIFKELNLLTFERKDAIIHYQLESASKTQLEKSNTYRSLQQYAESVINYKQSGGRP